MDTNYRDSAMIGKKIFKNSFFIGNLEVDADAYSEIFDCDYIRFLITAQGKYLLKKAARGVTALPLMILGGIEGGIEKDLTRRETPDKRPGVLVQLYRRGKKSKKLEIGERIRQEVLVRPGTRIFDYNSDSEKKYNTMEKVGYCADGYQERRKLYERDMISVPLPGGEFPIENGLGIKKGFAGGDILYFCNNKVSFDELTKTASKAVRKVDGAIAPFEICAGASKLGSNMAEIYEGTEKGKKYKEIGPTINEELCPSLRKKVKKSRVPEGISSISETIIDGTTLESVKEAMKSVIESVKYVDGVVGVSSANFGGKLGKHKIYFKDLFQELF